MSVTISLMISVHPSTATLIRKAFVHFYSLLKEHHYVDEEAIFIDGTKLEADANRYSFVWRKSIENMTLN